MARYSKLCLIGLLVYFFLYLAALAIAVIGTRGLFGVQPDGLAAIWLIFLGMPWTLALGILPVGDIPELVAQVFIGVIPLFNIWLLSLACRKRRRRR